jgi:hypothetical protein
MEAGLPNIFNQYSVDENRVTNALLQTLASSPSLSRSFLKEFLSLRVRTRRAAIVISAQKRPKAQGDRTDTTRAEKEKDGVLGKTFINGFPVGSISKTPNWLPVS